jgi:hypothetical protein
MTCRTEEINTGGKISASFDRVCDGQTVGHININRKHRKLRGRTVWFVNTIKVSESHLRQGHATALYEAAAQHACKKRSALASVERTQDSFSTEFWAKQERLGRAIRIPHAGENKTDAFVLDVCHRKDRGIDLSGFELPPKWPLYAAGVGLGLLLLKVAAPSPSPPIGPPLVVLASRKRYGPVLDAAALKYSLSTAFLRAVAYIESRWNPTAGSPVGAVGLLQLMPSTAQSLGVTDRTDPVQNANGGAKFLASLYQRAGSWPVALAAYNWGPGNVFGTKDKPPHMYSDQWPKNTQQYVRDILDAEQRGVG